MKKFFEILKKCPLFDEIDSFELETLLNCLAATLKKYEKNRFIFMAGERVEFIGIVLSGGVHVVQEDYWGNRTILAALESGEMFGEAFSCSETTFLPVSALAVQESDILLIDYRKIITSCSNTCGFHLRLIKNMIRMLADKNVMLTQKMEVLNRRTTREKLLSYLSAQAQRAGKSAFTIPFNRQELAEYLCVDRSAMSNELSKMRRDGILEYDKNRFELL